MLFFFFLSKFVLFCFVIIKLKTLSVVIDTISDALCNMTDIPGAYQLDL